MGRAGCPAAPRGTGCAACLDTVDVQVAWAVSPGQLNVAHPQCTETSCHCLECVLQHCGGSQWSTHHVSLGPADSPASRQGAGNVFGGPNSMQCPHDLLQVISMMSNVPHRSEAAWRARDGQTAVSPCQAFPCGPPLCYVCGSIWLPIKMVTCSSCCLPVSV